MSTGPRTVYAVSTGEYSDYRVHATFEEYADAARAAERLHGEVKSMSLYPPGDDSLTVRVSHSAWVGVSREGKIGKVMHYRDQRDVWDGRPVVDINPYDMPGAAYIVEVLADTEERARKAVGERAAQVAALILDGIDPIAAARGEARPLPPPLALPESPKPREPYREQPMVEYVRVPRRKQ